MTGTLLSQKRAERSSNFELLRLVAMILIVCHHYACFGGFTFPSGFSLGRFIVQMTFMGGKFGVNCYVLISGYFLSTQTRYRWKSIVKFIVQVTLFSVGIYLLLCLAGEQNFSIKNFLPTLFPLIFDRWWFATTYFALMLIAPFLTRAVNAMSRRQHLSLLVIMGIVWSLIPTLFNQYLYSNELVWFVFLFLVAAYLRRYPTFFDNRRTSEIILVSSILLTAGLVALFDFVGKTNFYFAQNANNLMWNQSLLILTMSLALFSLFRTMKPFKSGFVNLAASAMFGNYLIHDHISMRPIIWVRYLRCNRFLNSPLLPLYAIGSILAVFVVFTVLSYPYNLIIDRPLDKLLNKFGGSIEGFFVKLLHKMGLIPWDDETKSVQ